jgi:hypothetical protein
MKVKLLIFLLFGIVHHSMCQNTFARIENDKILIYSTQFEFKDNNPYPKYELVQAIPRYTDISRIVNIQYLSEEQIVTEIISRVNSLKQIFDIVKQTSQHYTNVLGFGLPGYLNVNFGYIEGQGWGLVLSCEGIFTYICSKKIHNFNETVFYFNGKRMTNHPINPTFNPKVNPIMF